MTLCFATNNKHKLEEVAKIIPPSIHLVDLRSIGCIEELEETTGTIQGNSRQKAVYVFDKYRIPCFADDSGLEVKSLQGAPGVDSAMYAGPQRSFDDNIQLLLKNLEEHSNREAQFITVITLITDKGSWQFEGILKGTILSEKRGTGGFGYDPVFLPHGHKFTLAEMTMEEKNKISHRSMAIQKLVEFLKSGID
jgi:XTP/dITP diphosphohydrolase